MTQHVVSGGERPDSGQAATPGLSLAEGKATLAGLRRVLVTAQVHAHCRRRRPCGHCQALRPLKDHRTRTLLSLFGTVPVRAPRFGPCRCGVACQRGLAPAAEMMPDRCTPDHERVLAGMWTTLPCRQARAALVPPDGEAPAPTQAVTLAIDARHVKSVRTCQMRSFGVMIARLGNGQGREVVFSSMPAEADRQARQPRHVQRGLGATATTPVTILSAGADGPRSLADAAKSGPAHHVLDWFHLSMRVQHGAQAVTGWATAVPDDAEKTAILADAVSRIRWRLWHGQTERALALVGDTLVEFDALSEAADDRRAGKVAKLDHDRHVHRGSCKGGTVRPPAIPKSGMTPPRSGTVSVGPGVPGAAVPVPGGARAGAPPGPARVTGAAGVSRGPARPRVPPGARPPAG